MSTQFHEQRLRHNSPVSDDLIRWLDAFLIDRQSLNVTSGTMRFYHDKIKLLVDYAKSREIACVSDFTPTNIREYLIALSANHNPGGVHMAYRCLKTFLNWFGREAEPANWSNPIRNIKAPKLNVKPLDPVDFATIEKLIKVCDKSQYHGARDYAIFLCLLDTGIRASEFCALNVNDVDVISGDVLIRNGKGGKPRLVVIGKRARKALRLYLRFRHDDDPALWVSDDGCRLTYWGLNLILKRRSKLAHVKKPGLHDFRRAFALSCLRSGMDVYSLQKLMGHADLSVLHRYLAQNDEDLRIAHHKFSPVDRLRS